MNKAPDSLARKVMRDPVHILAFGFGTGLAPFAPGTFGSLCGESAKRLGVHDHGGIVWDEIAGMYLTLFIAPVSVLGWVLAFVLFRVMDIVKPWPIRDLDHRLGGGLGIMLDDLAAALYAAILLGLYRWLMT